MGRRITRAFSKDLKSLNIKIVKVNNENYKVQHDNEFDDISNERKPPSRKVRYSIVEVVKSTKASDKNNKTQNNDGEVSFDDLQSCVKNGLNHKSSDKQSKSHKTLKSDRKYRSIVQQLRLVRKRMKSSPFPIRQDDKIKVKRVVKIQSRIVHKNDNNFNVCQTKDNSISQIIEDGERIFNCPTVRIENSEFVNKTVRSANTKINSHHQISNAIPTKSFTHRKSTSTRTRIKKSAINCKKKTALTNNCGTIAIWKPIMDLMVPIDYSSGSNIPPEPLTPPSTPKRNYKKQLLQLHQQQEAAAAAAAQAAALMETQKPAHGECSRSTSSKMSTSVVSRKRTVSERDGPGILERVPQVPAEVFIPDNASDDSEPIKERLKKQGNEKFILGPNRLLLRNELLHIKNVKNEVHCSMITPPADEDHADSSGFDYLSNVEAISDEESTTSNNPEITPCTDLVRVSEIAMFEEEEDIDNTLRWRSEWMHSNKHCVKIQRKLQKLLQLMYKTIYRDNNNNNQNRICNYNNQNRANNHSDEECRSLKEVILDLSLLQRYNYLYPDWELAFLGKARLLLEHLENYQKKKFKDSRPGEHLFIKVILYILEHNLILPKVLDVYPHLLFARYAVLLNIKNRIRYDCENLPGNSIEDTSPRPSNTPALNYTQTHQRVPPLSTTHHLPDDTTSILNSQVHRSNIVEDTPPIHNLQTNPTIHQQMSSILLNHYQSYRTETPHQIRRPNIVELETPISHNPQLASKILNHSNKTDIPQANRSNIVGLETPIHNLQTNPTIHQQMSSILLNHYQSYRTEIPHPVRRPNIVELELETPPISHNPQLASKANHSNRTEIPHQVRKPNIVELELETPPISHNPQMALKNHQILNNHQHSDRTEIPQVHIMALDGSIHNSQLASKNHHHVSQMVNHCQSDRMEISEDRPETDLNIQQVSVIKSTEQANKEFKYEPKPGWINKAEIIPYLNGDYLVLHPAKRRRIVQTYKPIIVLSDSDDDSDEEDDSDAETSAQSSETLVISAGTQICEKTINTITKSPKFNYINEEPTSNSNINNDQVNLPSTSVNPAGTGFDGTSAVYRQETMVKTSSLNQASKDGEHQFNMYDQTNRPQIHAHIHSPVSIRSVNGIVQSPTLSTMENPFNFQRQPNQMTTNNFRNINSLIAVKETAQPLVPTNGGPIIFQRSSSSNTVLENINQNPLEQHIFNERLRQINSAHNLARAPSREMINPQTPTYGPTFTFQRQLSQLSNSSSGGSVNGDRPATLHPQGYVLEMKNVEEMNIPADFKNFYEFVTKSQITNGNEPIRFTTFLELHNAGNLKTYQKKYVEYLKMKEQNGC